jgi:hypothetical protein
VLYLTESDYAADSNGRYKQKLAKLYTAVNKESKGGKRKSGGGGGGGGGGSAQAVVICQRTEASVKDFLEVQNVASLELSLAVLPVADQKQLPQLLAELYSASFGAAAKKNPFKLGRQLKIESPSTGSHAQILKTLLTVPGLGENGARTLLQNFGSIQAIACAKESDLSLAIGYSSAKAVHGYFNASTNK